MTHYIQKDALIAEIEKQKQLIFPKNTGEMKVADVPKPLEQGWLNALSWMKKTIDTLEVKEVDLEKHLKEDIEDVLFDLDGVAVKGATYYLTVEDVKNIAKHFFELGLKAHKEEEV